MSESPSLIEFPEDEPPTVTATYESRCGLCALRIYEGQSIILYEQEWCHDECVEEEEMYGSPNRT